MCAQLTVERDIDLPNAVEAPRLNAQFDSYAACLEEFRRHVNLAQMRKFLGIIMRRGDLHVQFAQAELVLYHSAFGFQIIGNGSDLRAIIIVMTDVILHLLISRRYPMRKVLHDQQRCGYGDDYNGSLPCAWLLSAFSIRQQFCFVGNFARDDFVK